MRTTWRPTTSGTSSSTGTTREEEEGTSDMQTSSLASRNCHLVSVSNFNLTARLILKAIFSRWQRRREQPGPPEPAQRPEPRPRTASTARGQAGAAPEAGRRWPRRAERQPAEPPARAGPGGGRDGGREEQGAAAAGQQGAQEEQWAEPEPGIRTVLSGYNENLGFTQRLRFSIKGDNS